MALHEELNLGTYVSSEDIYGITNGQITAVFNYLNGSTAYQVTWLGDENKPVSMRLHAPQLTVKTAEHEVANDVEPMFSLGSYVAIRPFGPVGVVTGHVRSISGCLEYEVTCHEPAVGVQRYLLEGQMLSEIDLAEIADESDLAISTEPIPVGAERGSMVERHTS